MKKILFILVVMAIMGNALSVYAREVPFTQDDRDRLIRLEIKVEEGQKSLQRQIDNLKIFMLWGFGVPFAGMGILLGFVIWDRRTALSPVVRKIQRA